MTKIIAHQTTSYGETIDKNYVRSVKFDRSEFVNLPNLIFTFFPTVWNLQFNTGKLTAVEAGNFQNAGDLFRIEFFNSRIDELLSNGFRGANNLREISFRRCKIGIISNAAFQNLPNLQRVRITGGQINISGMLRALPSSVEAVIMP